MRMRDKVNQKNTEATVNKMHTDSRIYTNNIKGTDKRESIYNREDIENRFEIENRKVFGRIKAAKEKEIQNNAEGNNVGNDGKNIENHAGSNAGNNVENHAGSNVGNNGEYHSGNNVDKTMQDKKQKKKSAHGFLDLYAFLVTIVAIVGIAVCIRLYSKNGSMEEEKNNSSEIGASKGVRGSGEAENEYDVEGVKELIKDYMENNKGTLEMLRELFPEDIVVYHSNKYVFIPVDEDLEKNDIDNEKIERLEDGEFVYVEDGEVVSHKGIDVSKYQGEIDWKKVADSGVEFAMIRVAYRGYGTGEIVEDENAKANITGALDAGIKVGAYFFSQAITEDEAIEEAKFTVDIIKKYNITYPVVFDTETTLSNIERAKDLTVEERTDIAIAFCEQIKKEGYTPVIYANLKWFAMSLDMNRLEDYEKWFAGYNNELYFPYKISMWQYAESGKIDGITGTVDMNISFKDWSEKTTEE